MPSTVKILEYKQSEGITVDENNPNSRITKDRTIIEPKTVRNMTVKLLLNGVVKFVDIIPPYSRNKVIDAINTEIISKRKTDIDVEFTI